MDDAWRPFEDGQTLGQGGTEQGIILLDEEHTQDARITLAQGGPTAPFAITCGVYGWMFHTCFCSNEGSARRTFEDMKRGLDYILDLIPYEIDPERDDKMQVTASAIEDFVKQFP